MKIIASSELPHLLTKSPPHCHSHDLACVHKASLATDAHIWLTDSALGANEPSKWRARNLISQSPRACFASSMFSQHSVCADQRSFSWRTRLVLRFSGCYLATTLLILSMPYLPPQSHKMARCCQACSNKTVVRDSMCKVNMFLHSLQSQSKRPSLLRV